MDRIDPKKYYGLLEIVALGVMGKSAVTVSRKILEDKLIENILDAEIGGSPDARRYKVKGANLIKYLKQ